MLYIEEDELILKNNNAIKKLGVYSWIVKILLITFILSSLMSLIAEASLSSISLPMAFVVLLIFVFTGVFFDALGVAIATVSITPFISMASKKVQGAKEGIYLIKRADIVSNLCNDVVGDICGIISGSAGTAIVLILSNTHAPSLWISVIIIASIASITVSGKALGKIIAMKDNTKIVLYAGRIIHILLSSFKRKA